MAKSKKRAPRILFTVKTPAPEILEEVFLTEQTWNDHVLDPDTGHPEMSGRLDDVRQTVAAPTLILSSATTTGSYLFINQKVTDKNGRLLRVPVKPVSERKGIVTSAYFSGNVTGAGDIVWRPHMKTPGGEK